MKTTNGQTTSAATNGTSDRQPGKNWKVVRDVTAHGEERWALEKRLSALELANRTKEAWLIAQAQKLREPMTSMAAMLGLMELAQQLALVRPLHQTPSEFDEAAFKHLRLKFERLVQFFNDLADITGETRLGVDSEECHNTTQSFPVSENTRI